MQLPPRNISLGLFRTMMRIRCFEEKVIERYPEQQMRTPVHLCIGQEAIAAGVCAHLEKSDYIFSTHRNHGHCIAKGMDYYPLLAEFYGRKTGCAGGKGGSMHSVDVDRGILGTTAIVGGNIPIAVGAAWSCSMQGRKNVSVVFFGDGASEEGTLHESLNFAVLKNLPVVLVCENNLYATASPIGNRQPACSTIASRAAAFGLPAYSIDGNNVLSVYESAQRAVERARNGHGPSFIEALTYRWNAHVGPVDDTKTGHRPPQELSDWQNRCPISRFKDVLLDQGLMESHLEEHIRKEYDEELESAIRAALADPEPSEADLLSHVFKG